MNIEEEKLKNTDSTPVESDVKTITATMVDNEDTGIVSESKDLSAIIPKNEVEISDTDINLESKDKTLKTDGAVIIGNILEEKFVINEKASFPEQIDIEQRKKNIELEKLNKKKKKTKKDENSGSKKSQNITSIVVLLIIIGLGVTIFKFINRKTEKDFELFTLDVELGEKLPIRTSEYVKPGIGNSVDELEYVLDTKEVIVDKVGTYTYTVTYKGIVKYGTINIVDTTSPKLSVKDINIIEGNAYTPESFVSKCIDKSGCNYSFENSDKVSKYNEAGKYDVVVVAKDPYGNSTSKKVKLVIESQGMVKKYEKEEPYNQELGYSTKITYDLHFTGFMNESLLFNGSKTIEYKYQDKTIFDKDVEKYKGITEYKVDVENMIIKYKTYNFSIVDGYSKMSDILPYLTETGFIEK